MKKQEEAVGQNEEEETLEQCIARVKEENPELTEEQARAKCTNKPAEEKPAATEDKAFMDKIMAVFNEAIDLKMKDFWTQVEKRMEEAVKKVQDQAITGLRKGLGVSEDPVIHLSELPEIVRKTLLEIEKPGKRTETETKEKPAEGSPDEPKKLPSSEDLYKKLTENRGAF